MSIYLSVLLLSYIRVKVTLILIQFCLILTDIRWSYWVSWDIVAVDPREFDVVSLLSYAIRRKIWSTISFTKLELVTIRDQIAISSIKRRCKHQYQHRWRCSWTEIWYNIFTNFSYGWSWDLNTFLYPFSGYVRTFLRFSQLNCRDQGCDDWVDNNPFKNV